MEPAPKKIKLDCKFGHPDRLFTHKVVSEDNSMLKAMVLPNGICLLVTKTAVQDVVSVSFDKDILNSSISGKRKKGARKIKPGSIVCTITLENEQSIEMKSPVGGQLVEANLTLQTDPTLLANPYRGGYVCVVYPTTPAMLMGEVNSRVCYDWLKGNCDRGDECKFVHANDK